MAAVARATCIASGLGFTEGPLWTTAGQLLVGSVSRGLVYNVDLESGTAVPWAEPGGNPSGVAMAADGSTWIAQGGGHARTSSRRPVRPGVQLLCEGVVEDVVTQGCHAPNDCAVGAGGRLWFTDPQGDPLRPSGPDGHVRALDPATMEVTTMAGRLRYPNGIAFDRDHETLFVAETGAARIVRMRVAGGGAEALGPPLELPSGHPDGLAIDELGRVHAAAVGADAVVVFGDDGKLHEVIELEPGSWPTNLCFGGPERTTLFVTAARGGRVLAIERDVPGLPLPTHQPPTSADR